MIDSGCSARVTSPHRNLYPVTVSRGADSELRLGSFRFKQVNDSRRVAKNLVPPAGQDVSLAGLTGARRLNKLWIIF